MKDIIMAIMLFIMIVIGLLEYEERILESCIDKGGVGITGHMGSICVDGD